MKPEYGYAAKDCRVPPPPGCSVDAAFVFDIHLVNWYPKDEVRVASDDGDVFKRSLGEVDSWETPRAPFEVRCAICFCGVDASWGCMRCGQHCGGHMCHLPAAACIL